MDEMLYRVVGSTDPPGMKPPIDPPPDRIAVRVPKAVLLLTEAEYARGLERRRWRRRIQATVKREADAVPPNTRAPRRSPTVAAR